MLAERVRAVAAALAKWGQLPAAEWQAALQQLGTLLSTGEDARCAAAGCWRNVDKRGCTGRLALR